jgi:hypothetical protein
MAHRDPIATGESPCGVAVSLPEPPAVPVPATSSLGLLLVAALLAGIAVYELRRRRSLGLRTR